jgi:hypothetical protein
MVIAQVLVARTMRPGIGNHNGLDRTITGERQACVRVSQLAAHLRDGIAGRGRVIGQTGRQATRNRRMKMTASKKTAVAVIALMGVALGAAAFAEGGMQGMGGMGGPEGRGPMMLEMFDTIDANKDRKVTQDELAAHRAAEFAAADTNSDGALSAEELQAHMLAQMLARHSARMIDNMDDDGNGTLSVEEMGEGPMGEHFARIDTDNDGAISKDEAQAAAEKMGKRREGRRHMMGDHDN